MYVSLCFTAQIFLQLVVIVLPGTALKIYNEGGVRVCSDAVLHYFWCGLAEIFVLACSFSRLKAVKGFYQFGKFLCVICGILVFFHAILQFLDPPLMPPL